MKKINEIIIGAGLILAILVSNTVTFIRDGRRLDALLTSGVLAGADSLAEAEAIAEEKLPEIERIAETVLREQGCKLPVTAELADVEFDKRVYGDITMPAGTYRALRVKIGSAQGHNWWCVMYPPLCIPAACEVTDDKTAEQECFSEEELDIMYEPEKYEVRFAIWDKLKKLLGD